MYIPIQCTLIVLQYSNSNYTTLQQPLQNACSWCYTKQEYEVMYLVQCVEKTHVHCMATL